jgi:hypothetical protein
MVQRRPWGSLQSIIQSFGFASWSFVGCVGTEDRALTSAEILASQSAIGAQYLVEVIEPADSPFLTASRSARESSRAKFAAIGLDAAFPIDLLAWPKSVLAVADAVAEVAGAHLIFDISCLPKRFFFPIVRALLRTGRATRDIVVTYTVPAEYARPDGRLSLNPMEAAYLPSFAGAGFATSPEQMFLSLGFQALGVVPILKSTANAGAKIDVLFPYPTRTAQIGSVWDFVREINEVFSQSQRRVVATSPLDVSSAYNRLASAPKHTTWLLPYGPKPISLAMALAAVRRDWSVYYTQPRHYRPDYSIGVAMSSGQPKCVAYVIRSAGSDLY